MEEYYGGSLDAGLLSLLDDAQWNPALIRILRVELQLLTYEPYRSHVCCSCKPQINKRNAWQTTLFVALKR